MSVSAVSVSYNVRVKLTLQYHHAVFMRSVLGQVYKSLRKQMLQYLRKIFPSYVHILKENIKDNYEHSYDICYQCKDYGGH